MPDDFDFRPSAGGQEPSCTPPAPFSSPIPPIPDIHAAPALPDMPAAPLQPPLSVPAMPPASYPPASYAPPVYPAAPQPPVNTPYTQQPYAQPYSPPPPVNTPPYSYYSPQQPGYTPVPYAYPAVPHRKNDGLAIASLVLGILSIPILLVGDSSVFMGIAGLILGIIAKSKGSGRMAVAGIVLSSIGLMLFVLMLVLAFSGFFISHEIFDDSYQLFRSLL